MANTTTKFLAIPIMSINQQKHLSLRPTFNNYANSGPLEAVVLFVIFNFIQIKVQ